MAVWYASLSLCAMWLFFRDPAIDYRLVVAGALAPDVLWLVSGRSPGAHALILPVAVMAAVMALTIGRRAARRRWLALPIGMFWHLVADGVWMQPALVWWPLRAAGGSYGTGLPLTERPLWLSVTMEIVGFAAGWWIWKKMGLDDAARRRRFWRTGRLDPSITARPAARGRGERRP